MMLEVDSIRVRYDVVPVLQGVSISMEEGEVAVLIGANGHGKTTLLRTISGLLRCETGKIMFEGEKISNFPPSEIVRRGVVHIPEGRRLFDGLTVLENLKLGAYLAHNWHQREKNLKLVFSLFPHLDEIKNRLAWQLSGGERQMTALGRGLMSSAKLLMIDEASLGLAPTVAVDVYETIREIHDTGVSLLIVEQNLKYVTDLASRMYLIENGAVTLEGKPSEIADKIEYVKEAYLGRKSKSKENS
ncbi:MAG: ABC transporter ATP-binding protein [Candidatus Bathyarchaeia archaeon]